MKRKLTALLLAAMLVLSMIPAAVFAGGPSAELKAASPTVVVVNSDHVGFSFDVEVLNADEAPYVVWYECGRDGQIISVDEDMNYRDIGFGGTALYIHGLTTPGEWHSYKAIINTDDGASEVYFYCLYDPAETLPTITADGELNPQRRNFTPYGEVDPDFEETNGYPNEGDEDMDTDMVVDMELTYEPRKLTYTPGEPIDLTGFKVRLLTENGFMDTEDASQFTVFPKNAPWNPDTYQVWIEYQGHFSVDYEIEVQDAPTELPMPFADVTDDSFFYNAVAWAFHTEPQVTDGKTPTKFGPFDTVTRGQAVTFMWRAFGKPQAENKKNPFTDVKTTDYFYDAVLWAVEEGITDGTTPTTFSPEKTCTNGHILTFLWRVQGRPGNTGAEKTNEWYKDAINWAEDFRLLENTYAGAAIKPAAPCPRAHVVTYLFRIIQSMAQF